MTMMAATMMKFSGMSHLYFVHVHTVYIYDNSCPLPSPHSRCGGLPPGGGGPPLINGGSRGSGSEGKEKDDDEGQSVSL